MAKLRELIEERRRLVQDHESGERRLGDEDFDRAARQLRNFQRKLEHLEETNNEVSLYRCGTGRLADRFDPSNACLDLTSTPPLHYLFPLHL
jgi:hypothetical protein